MKLRNEVILIYVLFSYVCIPSLFTYCSELTKLSNKNLKIVAKTNNSKNNIIKLEEIKLSNSDNNDFLSQLEKIQVDLMNKYSYPRFSATKIKSNTNSKKKFFSNLTTISSSAIKKVSSEFYKGLSRFSSFLSILRVGSAASNYAKSRI